MGDIGDYWREHKAHVRRRKMGITVPEEQQMEAEITAEKKAAHLAKCSIQCECGKWLLSDAAYTCHKQAKGKKGHKVASRREVAEVADVSWI